MWYSVLRTEMSVASNVIKAGSIYEVKKYNDKLILCIPTEGESAKRAGQFKTTIKEARTIFTRPTRDFNDAVEESFMQCEANYC